MSAPTPLPPRPSGSVTVTDTLMLVQRWQTGDPQVLAAARTVTGRGGSLEEWLGQALRRARRPGRTPHPVRRTPRSARADRHPRTARRHRRPSPRPDPGHRGHPQGRTSRSDHPPRHHTQHRPHRRLSEQHAGGEAPASAGASPPCRKPLGTSCGHGRWPPQPLDNRQYRARRCGWHRGRQGLPATGGGAQGTLGRERTLMSVLGWPLMVGGLGGCIWLSVLNVRHRSPDSTAFQAATRPDHWVGKYGDRYGVCAVAFGVGLILAFGHVG